MGKVLVGAGRGASTTAGSFGTFPNSGIAASATTESVVARQIRVAGNFTNFGVSADANGTARSIVLRKNSAAGQTLSPANSTQQIVYDNSTTLAYAATDTIDFQYNGSGTAWIPYFHKAVFEASSGTVGIYATGSGAHSANQFQAVVGSGASAVAEADQQTLMRTDGTVQFGGLCLTTASTAGGTVRLRKNGANGNITFTVGSGTTGMFEDTTHTDSFVGGDLLAWTYTLADGTGAHFCSIVYSGSASEVGGGQAAATSRSASDQFQALLKGRDVFITTEAVMKMQHGFDVTTSNFRTRIFSNTMTGSTTFKIRKNGADGNQTLTVGASATGRFEDTTNSDFFLAADDICLVQRGGTSGAIQPIGWTLTETPMATGTAQGVGTATGDGTAVKPQPGTAQGVGTATATGVAFHGRAGTAQAVGTATADATGIVPQPGTAQGVGTATAIGVAFHGRAGTAQAVGTAVGDGIGIAGGVSGNAQGVGTATGDGTAVKSSGATAQAVGTATGASASTAAQPGTAQGVGTATANGQAVTERSATAQGVGTVTGAAGATIAVSGTAQAVGTAQGVPGGGVSSGNAQAVGTATGVGTGIRSQPGTAQGVGTATASVVTFKFSQGTAQGVGTASATGAILHWGDGLAQGVSTALGRATSTAAVDGLAQGVGMALGVMSGQNVRTVRSGTATGLTRDSRPGIPHDQRPGPSNDHRPGPSSRRRYG